ncbi:MAG TPA: hypothetical protein PKH39_16305 [Woeseiaceae bacterium]|nr:hypothetical protein [Woeseiaceae bacterium]
MKLPTAELPELTRSEQARVAELRQEGRTDDFINSYLRAYRSTDARLKKAGKKR